MNMKMIEMYANSADDEKSNRTCDRLRLSLHTVVKLGVGV